MFSQSILVSIIVPIYNIDLFIEECIISLLNQRHTNIEIILVNDGSTDKSGDIAKKYALSENRIILFEKSNGGLISARKAGLRLANGEYITFVDGDDWVEPEYVSELLECLNNNFVDIVIANHKENLSGRIEVLENSINPGFYDINDLKINIWPKMLNNGKFSKFGIFSYLWGKLYRKSLIFDNQMNVDEKIFIGEDAACLYPSILMANKISIINSARYHYRQRVDSLIKTVKRDEIYKIKVFYNFLGNIFLKYEFNNILKKQLELFTLSLLAVRSNGPENKPCNSIFPFGTFKDDDRIIIIGSGTFGQHLVNRIKNIKNIKIVCWIDELFENYSLLGLNVNSFDEINNNIYDYIIIAYIDQEIAEFTTEKLINYGVNKENIRVCDFFNLDKSTFFLNEFGIL